MSRSSPALLLIAFALASAPAFAQPRSAIPWLSDSVTLPAGPIAPRPRPEGPDAPGDPATISVIPLGSVNLDGVGLLSPELTGLPRVIWGDMEAARVRDRLLDHPDRGVPAARAIFRRLLLAQAEPPREASSAGGSGETVLLARIDRLLDLGGLDEAEALIRAAGPESPEVFRRWFDIGLLTGRSEDQCAALRQNAALSPTLPARVFCLARGGDWNAAEITLTLGQGVGWITPEQEALLARFLDPVLFEEAPEPPVPAPLTALDFTLREAVGLPRPSGTLPLAFLQGDLDEHAPMRMRISAGERLTRAGSATPDELFAAYRAGAPAASGGVWDRARAVQDLDAALDGAPPHQRAEALGVADAAFSERGLRLAFAEVYAPAFVDRTATEVLHPDRVAELLLLAGEAEAAARIAGGTPSRRLAGLLALTGAGFPPPLVEDDLMAAAFRGLAPPVARDDRQTRTLAQIAGGRAGEAILDALVLLGAGSAIDAASLETALFTLVAAGQRDAARDVALQTLLLPQDG